ncbi:MFS transporter [Amycolatopsis acidiphila]|uniref:MFS transporter n=1 Tax=Amycolatopsis acidiphila TaxID=715473 RepID=A0A558AGF5_9PSEU|nr:MFS transporter [Amycolatopsis acidiphila]TVT23333.1 MFS transporter [Amycolatopsis acidiphila]UIJ56562.1 MFS transporter [Amycolatopsis acidiphila]GHG66662.1 MFS transporter [Amycolatopsis acidiphila]
MSPTTQSLSLPEFIDDRRTSLFQYAAIALCGLVMFLDGFDTQSINYLAPHIAKEWGLSKQLLGPIFSAALVGLMVGYLVLSPLSDRFGHKRLIIAGTTVFGVCTLVSVWSGNVSELMVLRFVTGVGLGAAAPSAIALTAEYSPKRFRASFVLAIYCGFSLGFVVAGLVSGWLIPSHGWRSVFVAGAIAPLVLVPLMIRWLPESLAFLIGRGAAPLRAYQLCRRIDRGLPADARPEFHVPSAPAGKRVRIRVLLTREWVLRTLLLWLVFAINLGEFYALQSWLPSMLTDLHYSASAVVSATTMTTVGGIAIALLVGPAMDRLGAFGSLAVLYVAGFVFLAATAPALHAPVWVLLVAAFLVGCGVSGGQKSLIALAAVFYPADVRSTGVGWALGIGRVGGILGPLVVGAALSAGWSAGTVFYALAVPMLASALVVVYLGRRARREAGALPEPAEARS